jgi:hypothetical protein
MNPNDTHTWKCMKRTEVKVKNQRVFQHKYRCKVCKIDCEEYYVLGRPTCKEVQALREAEKYL